MQSSIIIALIALPLHTDQATLFKLYLTIARMLTEGGAMKRILSGAKRKQLKTWSGIVQFLTERNAHSGINKPSVSPI